MIMDAQDIIELIEYFRNLQNNEMKFEIEELRGYIDIRFEELYDKLTEYIDFNHADSNEYIKLDRDKSTFKSHRDFSSEIEITFKHF